MRKYFFTGLGILLPIVLTILIVGFLINLLTKPFIGIAYNILNYYGILGKSLFFLKTDQIVIVTSKFIVLALLFILTLLVGLLARVVTLHYLFRFGDYIIHKIPIVNKVYRAFKEVITTVFESPDNSFSQVALVPFPHTQALSIGLVIKENLSQDSDKKFSDLVSVFVPATPNPTMGFMLLYKRENLTIIDMKVEDALKCLVSCGVLFAKNEKKNRQKNGNSVYPGNGQSN